MLTEHEQLESLVPPPKAPVHAGSMRDFASVEAKLGTELPLDFKLLVTTYGTGGWLEFYAHANPLDPRHADLWFDGAQMRWLREFRQTYPQFLPYPIWPDAGGLIRWGGHENGGDMFWLTEGKPDRWPTIFTLDRTPEYIRIDQTCTKFILSAIDRSNPVVAEIPWSVRKNPELFQSF